MLLPSIGAFSKFLNLFGFLQLFVSEFREIENMRTKIVMTFKDGPSRGVKLRHTDISIAYPVCGHKSIETT